MRQSGSALGVLLPVIVPNQPKGQREDCEEPEEPNLKPNYSTGSNGNREQDKEQHRTGERGRQIR